MTSKYGLTSENIETLSKIRDKLSKESPLAVNGVAIDDSQWKSIENIVGSIYEACKTRDLDKVAGGARSLRNRLRKRTIKRAIESLGKIGLSHDESSPEGNGGECKCESCGTVIDGTTSPCIKGGMCSDCALKSDPDASKEFGSKSVSTTGVGKVDIAQGTKLRKRRYNS